LDGVKLQKVSHFPKDFSAATKCAKLKKASSFYSKLTFIKVVDEIFNDFPLKM
jgi:hypothetical protein